jgi:hypothetical protein
MEGIEDTFRCGVVIGFIVAGIIGFILVQLRTSSARMGQRNRTMDNFPASVQSRMTPSNVGWASRRATVGCIFWIIMLIVVVYLAYLYLSPMIDFG